MAKIFKLIKKTVFYNRAKVKRAKDVPVFSRRIYFCSNYTLIFDELKNFCHTTGQSFANPKETEQATRVATMQLNLRAKPWVWGHPPKDHRRYRRLFCYRI